MTPLHLLYGELNTEFWAGRLPPAAACVRDDTLLGGDPRTRSLVVQRRARLGKPSELIRGVFKPPLAFWPGRIQVLAGLGPKKERLVLLHEMVHVSVWMADGYQGLRPGTATPTATPDSHGPLFLAELRRLAAAGAEWAEDEVLAWPVPPFWAI